MITFGTGRRVTEIPTCRFILSKLAVETPNVEGAPIQPTLLFDALIVSVLFPGASSALYGGISAYPAID